MTASVTQGSLSRPSMIHMGYSVRNMVGTHVGVYVTLFGTQYQLLPLSLSPFFGRVGCMHSQIPPIR